MALILFSARIIGLRLPTIAVYIYIQRTDIEFIIIECILSYYKSYV